MIEEEKGIAPGPPPAKPTRAELLAVITRLQDLVGAAEANHQNDRDPQGFQTGQAVLREAFRLCVSALGRDAPVSAERSERVAARLLPKRQPVVVAPPKGPVRPPSDHHDVKILLLVHKDGPRFFPKSYQENRAYDLARRGYLSGQMATYRWTNGNSESRQKFALTEQGKAAVASVSKGGA